MLWQAHYVKKGEWHPLLDQYGMVIVDECHHAASDTIAEVLQKVTAKYVYGVTATPKRSDGLEKINYMLLGPIRYSYSAKEKVKAQGIPHLVYPRFTRTVLPRGVTAEKMHPNEAYEMLRHNEARDEQILSDVKNCIAAGRTPVILSKYKDHSERLYDQMKGYADRGFLMTGNNSKKEHKQIREQLQQTAPDDYGFGDAAFWMQLHEDMRQAGFFIKTVEDSCENFAVIDQEIIWYGNIHLLGREKVEDNIMRVKDKKLQMSYWNWRLNNKKDVLNRCEKPWVCNVFATTFCVTP